MGWLMATYKRRCVYCDTIREEVAGGERVVAVTPHFVAFVPYAARVSFELRVLPRRHSCLYEEISESEVAEPPDRLARVVAASADSNRLGQKPDFLVVANRGRALLGPLSHLADRQQRHEFVIQETRI